MRWCIVYPGSLIGRGWDYRQYIVDSSSSSNSARPSPQSSGTLRQPLKNRGTSTSWPPGSKNKPWQSEQRSSATCSAPTCGMTAVKTSRQRADSRATWHSWILPLGWSRSSSRTVLESGTGAGPIGGTGRWQASRPSCRRGAGRPTGYPREESSRLILDQVPPRASPRRGSRSALAASKSAARWARWALRDHATLIRFDLALGAAPRTSGAPCALTGIWAARA